MIVDAFTFHDEWECLEIRVRELAGIVDRVLLVEGNTTFTGNPRPLADMDRLQAISPLIERLVIDLQCQEDAWHREFHQRNSIVHGITDLVSSDLVLISDVDEIPRRQAMLDAVERSSRVGQISFELDQFYFRLNLKDEAEIFCGPRLLRRGLLTYPNALRCHYERADELAISHAGWHFGWLGSPQQSLAKIQAFSHQELNVPDIANMDFLETCQRLGMTAHNGHLLTKVEIDDSFPILVREQPERFQELIAP